MPNPKKVIWQKKEQIQKSPRTSAIIPQIILMSSLSIWVNQIKITSVLNGGVHSKAVKIPKTSTSVHIVPIGYKLFLVVPINVSSHDL